MKTWSN